MTDKYFFKRKFKNRENCRQVQTKRSYLEGDRNETQPLPGCLTMLAIGDDTGSSEFPVTSPMVGQDADVRSGSLDLRGR